MNIQDYEIALLVVNQQIQVFSFFSHQNAVNKSFPCNTVGGSKTGLHLCQSSSWIYPFVPIPGILSPEGIMCIVALLPVLTYICCPAHVMVTLVKPWEWQKKGISSQAERCLDYLFIQESHAPSPSSTSQLLTRWTIHFKKYPPSSPPPLSFSEYPPSHSSY